MTKSIKKTIVVKGIAVSTRQFGKSDFISLTDIANYKDDERTNYIVQNWMRNRSTIEFLGLWEKLNNPNFNSIEFDAFKFGIVYFLPQTKKFDSTSISHPVLDDMVGSFLVFVFSDIG